MNAYSRYTRKALRGLSGRKTTTRRRKTTASRRKSTSSRARRTSYYRGY